MFSDNVQVSQSPIQRCLYLHVHSELTTKLIMTVLYTLSLGAFGQKHG